MQMMTVVQAAHELAVAEVTIRVWLGQRKISYVRIGWAIRVPSSEIERFIEAGTVPAKKG
jgi:excisionase family DNA binding protein